MTHSDILKVHVIRGANHHSQGMEIIQGETILNNIKEGFSIAVRTHGEDCQILEVAQITISLPGQKEWVGTIQDFMAIAAVANNSREFIIDDAYYGVGAICCDELDDLLNHFKSSVPGPPSAI